jgi:hypothetical protein
VLSREARRLGEAVVEETEPPSGDVRHHGVEDDALRFVRVKAEIQEIAQEASALGDAETVGARERRLAVCAVNRIGRAATVGFRSQESFEVFRKTHQVGDPRG